MKLYEFKARARSGHCELGSGAYSGISAKFPGYVAEARDNVVMSLAMLQNRDLWPRISPLYRKYFLTELEDGRALEDVMALLLLTMNGLNGDIRMKVVKRVPVSSMNVGEAVAKVEDLSALRSPLDKSKGQNEVKDLLTGATVRVGDIVLEKDLVNRRGMTGATGYNPVKTIVHEATHKFAGTIDYWYFSVRDGSSPDKYGGAHAGAAREFGASSHDKEGAELARMNADSFAWFCHWVGGQIFRGESKHAHFLMRGPRGPGGMIG